MLGQRYAYTHISWLAALSFLHSSKQDQIKIVFVAECQVLFGSTSICSPPIYRGGLGRVFVLLIHRFCFLVISRHRQPLNMYTPTLIVPRV